MFIDDYKVALIILLFKDKELETGYKSANL